MAEPAHGEGARFPPEGVRACLERVVASRELRRSARLVRFLRFVVEAVLEDHADEVKERSLAVEVYGRSLDYDPTCDPIVRSEAHRLRSKLDAYYEADGAVDPIQILLPKGSYLPEFRAGAATPRGGARRGQVYVGRFEDRSAGRRQEAFAQRMGDAVREALAARGRLRVLNRSSRARGARVPREAEYVVDGSLERAGAQCRVTARLVRRADAEEVWSGSHAFRWEDVAEAHGEVARQVAESLAAFLTRAGRPALPAGRRAYELFVNGRHAALQYGNSYDLRHVAPARKRLEAALELEPRFPDALAELANLDLMQLYPPRGDSGALLRRARATLERALDVEPRHPRSLYLMGHVLGGLGRRREALELTETAVATDPEDPEGRLYLAVRLLSLGFWEAALASCDWALRLDPVWDATQVVRAAVLLHLGRLEEVHRWLELVADWDPVPVEHEIGRGLALLAEGKAAEAAERLARADGAHPGHAHLRALRGLAEARGGDRREAGRILAAQRDSPPFFRDIVIRLALALGEEEIALARLAASPFHRHYRWLASEPSARPLLGRPAGRALLEELYAEWQRNLEEIAPRLAAPPPDLPPPKTLLEAPAAKRRRVRVASPERASKPGPGPGRARS